MVAQKVSAVHDLGHTEGACATHKSWPLPLHRDSSNSDSDTNTHTHPQDMNVSSSCHHPD